MGTDKAIMQVASIHSLIYQVRSQNVMFDRDLAVLYGVETRALNQAVRRNRERFPDDFMFALRRDEIRRMSQSVISSAGQADLKFSKSVLVLTEQGVAMLSSVLHSPRAIAVNIAIMRAFVQLRQMLAPNADLARKLAALESNYDGQFKVVFDAIRNLMTPPKRSSGREIGFHAAMRARAGKLQPTSSRN